MSLVEPLGKWADGASVNQDMVSYLEPWCIGWLNAGLVVCALVVPTFLGARLDTPSPWQGPSSAP